MKFLNNNRCVFVLMMLLTSISINAQIQRPGNPVFHPVTDSAFIPVIEIEPLAIPQKQSVSSQFKVDEFAIPVEVDISPENYGVWIHYPHLNKRVWLLRIKSAGARSLNFLFDKYHFKPGVKLFIYNKSQSIVYGAFTHLNNKEWKSLSVKPIYSNEVYIELQVPNFADNFGEFNLGQLGIEKDVEVSLKSTSDEYFDRSATCHVNVNCLPAGYYQRQKKSVCRIIYRGGRRCTGTLINNLKNDGKAYVISAGHCISTDFVAQSAIFDFGYESPTCEGEDIEIPSTHSISGATLLSTAYVNRNLDFVLLELSERPQLEAEPFYSGWDATGEIASSSYVLHHPEGDVKKISVEEDEVKHFNVGGFDPNSFWLVENYETGSSQEGSSGAGLVSEENLLVGTLTGGGDTCSVNIFDYYQKFSRYYNDYADSSMQLKYWLDPENTNVLKCSSRDETLQFRETAEIVTNIISSDSPQIIKQSNGWGYLSGHNYQNNSVFAEKLMVNGSKYLYGANLDIATMYASNFDQRVVFTVWEGGSQPGNVLYEHEIPTADLDVSPYKIDFDSTLLVHNEFFFGYRINYESDTFALKTVATTAEQNTAYTMMNNNWVPLQFNGDSYSSKLSLEVLAFDYLPIKGTSPDSTKLQKVHIYPNPSSSSFQAFFKEGITGLTTFKIYNLQGKLVYEEVVSDVGSNVQVNHNLPAGVYIMNIFTGNSRYQANKLIVM